MRVHISHLELRSPTPNKRMKQGANLKPQFVLQSPPILRAILDSFYQGFDPVTRLLAAGVDLLVLWIGRAMNRALRGIRPHRRGGRDPSGLLAASLHGSIFGVSSWERLWVRSCLIQHGTQKMNPLIRMQLGRLKELPWYFSMENCLWALVGQEPWS
jgi:hypothetical protein